MTALTVSCWSRMPKKQASFCPCSNTPYFTITPPPAPTTTVKEQAIIPCHIFYLKKVYIFFFVITKPPHHKKQNHQAIWIFILLFQLPDFFVHSWKKEKKSRVNKKDLITKKNTIQIVGELRNFWRGDCAFTFVIIVFLIEKLKNKKNLR